MTGETFRTGIGNKAAVPRVDGGNCNLCGLCVKVCGMGLTIRDGAIVFDDDVLAGCIGCGQCMAVCPTGSITITGRKISPDMRLVLPSGSATPEQLEALLLKRRSVRIYSDKPVDKDIVDRILGIASTAPMGIPPSDVGVLVFNGRDRVAGIRDDLIDYFASLSKYFNRALLVLLRPFMKKPSYEMMRDFIRPVIKEYQRERGKGNDVLFYDCPLLLIFHCSPYADPADPVIAATYAMIAAESLGLGTCMNGMVPVMGYSKKLKRRYGIPKDNKVSLGIMMGYPGVKYQWALHREFASVDYW